MTTIAAFAQTEPAPDDVNVFLHAQQFKVYDMILGKA